MALVRAGGSLRRHLPAPAGSCRGIKDWRESIQDPKQTGQAYSQEDRRQVPDKSDEGVEREVKWGKNIPASGQQLKEELKYAGGGLAESVAETTAALANKARDAAAEARIVGLGSDRPRISDEQSHGAGGKMEYAPPGSQDGGPAADRAHARAKYDEIADTEKPNFPAGERSVNDMFPDMAEAAREQSSSPDKQRAINEELAREMRTPSSGTVGDNVGKAGGAASKSELNENLHNRGP